MKKRPYFLLIFLSLFPSAVLADGVSPILNLFHKETWLPASIVTVVIILVEGGLLRWRIRGVRFGGALGRSVLINVASSITGSVLLLAFSRDSFFMWDTMAFILPLFLITLVTEIPLLHVLFKCVRISWARACLLGFGINIASYAAVFALEIGLLFGGLSYADHLDRKESVEWNNPGLLQQASGVIYGIESLGHEHRLQVLDLSGGRWETLTNCPSIELEAWDVEGNICAFVREGEEDRKDRRIVVSRLPEFETLQEIPVATFVDAQTDDWQGVEAVAVSPDGKKLAILFRFMAAVAPRDRSSHYNLGGKCRAIVIDLASGEEVARTSRWASGYGLCWLPDSRRVLFVSFDDESVYEITEEEVSGSISYGLSYVKDGQFERSLYSFDINTGDIAYFAKGYYPAPASRGGGVLVRDDPGLLVLDESGGICRRIDVKRLGYGRAVISPEGDMIAAVIQRHGPFSGGGRLTLMDLHEPEVRHILDEHFYYRFDWAVDEAEAR